MAGARRLWAGSVALSVLLHLAPCLPWLLEGWGRAPSFLARSSWREPLAGAARSRQRVLLTDVVLLGPATAAVRVATTRPEEQTERVRAVQRAIRLAWNAAEAPVPGRAMVALRLGEDGRIHEYAIQRLAGDTAFERFLVRFVRALLDTPAVAGPGAPLWVECEFVVEPPR